MRILFLFSMLLFQLKSFSQQHKYSETSMFNFCGKIGSNIPAFLSFEITDSTAVGHIKYLKSKSSASIKIIGTLTNDGNVKLNEFYQGAIITGIFYGKLHQGNFSGSWFSPKTRKAIGFNFTRKDTVVNISNSELKSKYIAGKYSYSYGKEGAQGNLIVSVTNRNLIGIKFSNYTDSPDRNSAEFSVGNLSLSGNEIICRFENSCVFRIKFFEDFVVVSYLHNQRDCGFGNGADVDGVYLKVKN
jgi:hypothetical protein